MRRFGGVPVGVFGIRDRRGQNDELRGNNRWYQRRGFGPVGQIKNHSRDNQVKEDRSAPPGGTEPFWRHRLRGGDVRYG